MNNFKKINSISNYQLYKQMTNPRIIIVGVFLILLTLSIMDMTNELINNTGVNGSLWNLPFLFTDRSVSVFYGLAIILLFCDAPFTEANEPYLIIRTSRKIWFAGQIFYIVKMSLIYAFFVFIVSFMSVFPHINLSLEWGKILNTVAYDATSNYGLYVPKEILIKFSPVEATLYVVLLLTLVSSFLGSLLLMINLLTNRFVGIIIGTILILFVVLAELASGYTMYYFSPFSWVSLIITDIKTNTLYPNIEYVLSVYSISSVISWIVGFIKFNKSDINILESI